jgi:hypothetical protein
MPHRAVHGGFTSGLRQALDRYTLPDFQMPIIGESTHTVFWIICVVGFAAAWFLCGPSSSVRRQARNSIDPLPASHGSDG